jgi:hypothetical protein
MSLEKDGPDEGNAIAAKWGRNQQQQKKKVETTVRIESSLFKNEFHKKIYRIHSITTINMKKISFTICKEKSRSFLPLKRRHFLFPN